jgi:hypothetical protein
MNPMTIEYKIHIDPQQIRIQDPQTGYHEEMSNRAVVLPKDRLVLGLGESEEKVRARLIARFQKSANDLRTLALFGPRGDDLDYEIQVLQFLARLLNTQSLSVRGWRHYGALLGSDFDYNLEIPGYESFSEARRHALEHNFQARQPLRRLAINGQEVQIPPSKRRLELWARRVFSQALPIIAIVLGYLLMPRSMAGSWFTFFIFLTVIGYLFYYGGRVAWMLLARRLVPHDYCMNKLQGNHRRISQIDLWLAQKVWGTPPAGSLQQN